jgi:hypothetical protein
LVALLDLLPCDPASRSVPTLNSKVAPHSASTLQPHQICLSHLDFDNICGYLTRLRLSKV